MRSSIWIIFLIISLEFSVILGEKRLLVVSFDGMRADKFDEHIKQYPLSNFSRIINNGLKADYMTPIFPSVTYPNHWTLVTGLYAETHGVVGNSIYDPISNRIIDLLGDPNIAHDVRWWNRSDPIWLTAKRKGLKTATSFWPGSEVWTRTADIYLPYSQTFDYISRIDELINWYLKFNIDLAFIYFSQPDSAGHSFGPDSQEYRDKIKEMDVVLGYLLNSLENKRLLNEMNVIVTSDHGMAKSNGPPILVTTYVDPNIIDFNRSIFAYVSHIYPKDMSQLKQLYDALNKLPNMTVYYKKDVPFSFHYSNSDRIGPIVVVADEGYLLTSDPSYKGMNGIHGYDNRLLSMRTIFLAFGPSFKKAQKIEAFDNINVYPLMCKLLNLGKTQGDGNAKIFEPYLLSSSIIRTQSDSLIYLTILISVFLIQLL